MSRTIRQVHRWVSVAFTLGVLTYIITMSLTTPPMWLGLFALIPLIILLGTGLYLFVLPYAMRRKRGRVL